MADVIEVINCVLAMSNTIRERDVEVTLLKNELNDLKQKKCGCNKSVSVALTQIEAVVLDIGKRETFNKIFQYSLYRVNVNRNDNKEIVFESYNNWVLKNVKNNSEKIPYTLSQSDIIDFFDTELREKYKEKCIEEQETLIKKEQESKEDEE